MSKENVEIVRRANGAYAAGGMDAALRYFTDDTVLYSIPEWPDDPEYHGHDGLRRLSGNGGTTLTTSASRPKSCATPGTPSYPCMS